MTPTAQRVSGCRDGGRRASGQRASGRRVRAGVAVALTAALFGGTVTDAVSYVITAKNLRAQVTPLRVEEQIPVAADSRIEVAATETSGAPYNAETGRLAWQVRLQPNETRTWKLAYEIKYPKKTAITVD